MKINLSKIKVGKKYRFNVYYDYGAGSGSQGWYNVIGEVKEINAEFIRVIPMKNIEEGNKRSVKLTGGSITEVETY
jgi:hypothetical protein